MLRGVQIYAIDEDGKRNPLDLRALKLIVGRFDYIGLTYTGSNLTGVVYKSGGASGATLATLTLAYTGSRLDSVTKT